MFTTTSILGFCHTTTYSGGAFSTESRVRPLFLALEPRIFVSRIRCRIFRSWKAAEDYYANSLRQAQSQLSGQGVPEVIDDEDEPSGLPPAYRRLGETVVSAK